MTDHIALAAEKSTRRKFNLHYIDVLQAEIESLQDDVLKLENQLAELQQRFYNQEQINSTLLVRLEKLDQLHTKGSEDA